MVMMRLVTITVGIRIGGLVLEDLDQAVENDCQDCAEKRSNPVDPVVRVETAENDTWTEGPSGI